MDDHDVNESFQWYLKRFSDGFSASHVSVTASERVLFSTSVLFRLSGRALLFWTLIPEGGYQYEKY